MVGALNGAFGPGGLGTTAARGGDQDERKEEGEGTHLHKGCHNSFFGLLLTQDLTVFLGLDSDFRSQTRRQKKGRRESAKKTGPPWR